MAEEAVQTLGVKITEDKASTAAVVSSLDRVEKKIEDLSKAGAADRKSMAESAAANKSLALSVEGLAGSLEKKFAATDKVLSVLGKATGALGLVAGVVAIATTAYKALVPEVDLLNGRLAEQERRAKGVEAAMKSLATVQGSVRFIDPDDLLTVARAERDYTDAQAERLLLATQQVEAQAELEDSGRRLAEVNAKVGASEEDKARALAGFVDRAAELNARIVAFRDAQVAAAGREADAETRLLTVREEAQRKAAAPLATVPFDPNAGGGGGGGGGGRRGGGGGRRGGGPGPTAEEDILANLPDLRSEWLAKLGLGGPSEGDGLDSGGGSPFGLLGRGIDAVTAAIDAGLAKVQAYIAELQEIAAAYELAGEQALDFGVATTKGALTAAVAAAFTGESIREGVENALLAKSQEATVEALWWLGKAAVFSITAPQFVGPALAGAGYFGAIAAATGAGGAALGAVGGGGGGGGGGPATGGAGGLGRRLPDEGGGATVVVNVDYRGASIDTKDDIARSVVSFVRRGVTMLGGAGLPENPSRRPR